MLYFSATLFEYSDSSKLLSSVITEKELMFVIPRSFALFITEVESKPQIENMHFQRQIEILFLLNF